MSFLYPLGLLGLIGIPVLIIIYIIKNKYTEQIVPSTYLWELSERFLKKRLPINKLVGIISLILQILAVLFLSFTVAQPVFTLADAADDYCFVLDGSGSMNFEQDGTTRLELAKTEIAAIIGNSVQGSSYSLVLAGSTTDIIFDGITEKEDALVQLEKVSPSCTADSYTDAIGLAQGYFNDNPSVVTYLVTDKDFAQNDNINVINVAVPVENYAVSDVSYKVSGSKLLVEGKVVSYESEAELTVELYLDDAELPAAVQTVTVDKLELTAFPAFECEQTQFERLRVAIAESDALPQDNEITVYNVDYENSFSVLFVSDEAPIFIQAALISAGNARLTVVPTKEYTGEELYDLYIFDSYNPATLPRYGAVWFINPTESVADTGFTVQDEITYSVGERLTYSTSSVSLVRTLLQYVSKESAYLVKYQKCGFYRNFTTLISCGGNPVVFTGTNAYGNREAVFAFALRDSDFTVLTDYVVLVRNLLNYTFPKVVEETSYYCGETLTVNLPSNSKSVSVVSPSGVTEYPDSDDAICEILLTEAGTYSVKLRMVGDTSKEYSVYASLPEEERIPIVLGQSFSLQGEAGEEHRDGFYDDLLAFFIVLAVVFIADWMVYCYEQYQLR